MGPVKELTTRAQVLVARFEDTWVRSRSVSRDA